VSFSSSVRWIDYAIRTGTPLGASYNETEMARVSSGVCLALLLAGGPAAAVSTFAQVPVPFPSAGSRVEAPEQAPPQDAAELPIYPAAQFLEEFDAGRGQKYLLYGTNTPYDEIVTYYKNTLRDGGREIFKDPPMHQWELARFQSQTMAYPPSVVVKDYTWNGSAGYLHVEGTMGTRYRTIIQIVPPPGR